MLIKFSESINGFCMSHFVCIILNLTHLQAIGFYGAKGIAGNVPYMYIQFARQFLESVEEKSEEQRVKYLEYSRKGWTFHTKGKFMTKYMY